MNPWNSVATYRRNRQVWGLLIAGIIRSAISRPLDLFRRRLAGGDSTVSSLDETYQWFHPAGPVCFFGCGPRAGLGAQSRSFLRFSDRPGPRAWRLARSLRESSRRFSTWTSSWLFFGPGYYDAGRLCPPNVTIVRRPCDETATNAWWANEALAATLFVDFRVPIAPQRQTV